MKNKIVVFLLFCISILSGCTLRNLYYVSPYNGTDAPYHAIPLSADSVKSSTSAGGDVYIGSANEDGTDNVFLFSGNINRTAQWNHFQAYYGLDLSLGNYGVAKVDSFYNSPSVNFATINSMDGNKFFEGLGASGGINFVLPFNSGEWRVLGLELSSHREFGDYLNFRDKLPGTAATLIVKNDYFTTWGFYSEILSKTSYGNWGFRFSSGRIIEPDYNNLGIYDARTNRLLVYGYINFATHFTWDKWTTYMQLNFATKATGVKFGAVYQLGARYFHRKNTSGKK
jgi:hypothetical protein